MALAVVNSGKGGVALQLERDGARAAEIVKNWQADGRSGARVSVWLDAPFIVLYVATLALACRMIGNNLARGADGPWSRAGVVFAGITVAAGVLDAIENVGLLHMLNVRQAFWWWSLTSLAAWLKWRLVVAVLMFLALAGSVFLFRKRLREE